MPVIDFALSLGPNCRGKHHLQRRFGAGSPSGVFDWQVTPPGAVHAYLSNDFQGMFELADLEVRSGIVWNARFGTSHQHEFPRALQQHEIAVHYERARSRHVYLCGKTKRLLRGSDRALLVFSRPVQPNVATDLQDHLVRYCQGLRFHLLIEPAAAVESPDWRGNRPVWDNLLEGYRVQPVRRVLGEIALTTRRTYRQLIGNPMTATSP